VDLLPKVSRLFYTISQTKKDMLAILEQPVLLDLLCLRVEQDNLF
jgi:hypothetical protein